MTLLLVTLVSMLLAAIMSIVAWHSSREERRRSEARIAALAAEIHDGLAMRPAGAEQSGDLFAARQPARGGFRFATVAAGGLFVCGSAAALAVVSSHTSSNASSTASSSALHAAADRSVQTAPASVERHAEAVNAAAAVPIELVALGHDREGDRLIVRGIVRNPSSGAALDRVTAVVLLFKDDGGFLGSGRATVESPALSPGGETAFAVTVPGANGVGRYRVSFRSEDRIVPHIDRRARPQNLEPRTLEP
jgi:hypothetical protein